MIDFVEVKANARSIWLRGSVFGIGTNDADYQTQSKNNGKKTTCPYYRKWVGMLERCYSVKYQARRPTYIGATVAEEWLLFSTFKQWMETQDWEGLELDKDILVAGNKHYSPSTCCFVPRELNQLLNDRGASRGALPRGVYLNSGKCRAQCSYKGKIKHLGYHSTPKAASLAYRKYKHAIVRKIASEQSDPRIMRGLVIHADLILSGS